MSASAAIGPACLIPLVPWRGCCDARWPGVIDPCFPFESCAAHCREWCDTWERLDFLHAIGAELDIYRPLRPDQNTLLRPPLLTPSLSPPPVPERDPARCEKSQPADIKMTPPDPHSRGVAHLGDVAPPSPAEPPPKTKTVYRFASVPMPGRLIDLVV